MTDALSWLFLPLLVAVTAVGICVYYYIDCKDELEKMRIDSELSKVKEVEKTKQLVAYFEFLSYNHDKLNGK